MSTSSTDYGQRMAEVRNGLLTKAIGKAHAKAAELGITLTDEQAAESGRRILKAEQRERAALARAALERSRILAKGRDDIAWVGRQAASYAAILHAYAPDVPSYEQLRICWLACQDEFEAPDGFHRDRAVRRLQAIVDSIKAQSQARSDVLDATIVARPPRSWRGIETGGEWSPTLDETAAEQGEPSWSGLTDEQVADRA